MGIVVQRGFIKFPDPSQEQNFPCASEVDLALARSEYFRNRLSTLDLQIAK